MSSNGKAEANELSNRRAQTAARIETLRGKLVEAEKLASGKACVYATGSFGRGEASQYSDLDLFIVGKGFTDEKTSKKSSLLNGLDEICIKADLIRATRELKIPEFSGDGKYLVHYAVHDLTDTLGKPDDDATNTFTARLLLLLESCPLLGADIYKDVTSEVLGAYWRDYSDHRNNFVPAFLSNDILRLWRTFCVNYEANTETEPALKKAKRKLKNYKLKHSRLLTCYSAILYLLAIYGRHNTVTPENALQMIEITPTQRLEWLLEQSDLSEAHGEVRKVLGQYLQFLHTTNASEDVLVNQFMDKDTARKFIASAYKLGDYMFHAINKIGQGNLFHRLLVV
jgi:hypothetical protein